MPSEHLEPQPYRVKKGMNFQQNMYTYEEAFVAGFNSPQECADFVAIHNRLIDKIDLLEYELKETLDELKMHGV